MPTPLSRNLPGHVRVPDIWRHMLHVALLLSLDVSAAVEGKSRGLVDILDIIVLEPRPFDRLEEVESL